MKNDKRTSRDDTLLIALEQLGQTLEMMQGLFNRIEAHVGETAAHGRTGAGAEPEPLTPDIPEGSTFH